MIPMVNAEPLATGGDACIRVSREGGGRRDAVRAYTVVIDGNKAGTLRPGETREFAVEPGHHRLRMKIDWTGSEERDVLLQSGQVRGFICRPNGGTWQALTQLLPGGSRWIDLHAVDASQATVGEPRRSSAAVYAIGGCGLLLVAIAGAFSGQWALVAVPVLAAVYMFFVAVAMWRGRA